MFGGFMSVSEDLIPRANLAQECHISIGLTLGGYNIWAFET